MIKKEIILNDEILGDLSNNAVQCKNEEFIFGYDKILDEKNLYTLGYEEYYNKELTLLKIYKEFLINEYLEELSRISIKNKKIFKNSSDNKSLEKFLNIKNELSYICDLFEKEGGFDKFNFWTLINKVGFDENDTFWYKNIKNIDTLKFGDIYNYFTKINKNYIDEKIINNIKFGIDIEVLYEIIEFIGINEKELLNRVLNQYYRYINKNPKSLYAYRSNINTFTIEIYKKYKYNILKSLNDEKNIEYGVYSLSFFGKTNKYINEILKGFELLRKYNYSTFDMLLNNILVNDEKNFRLRKKLFQKYKDIILEKNIGYHFYYGLNKNETKELKLIKTINREIIKDFNSFIGEKCDFHIIWKIEKIFKNNYTKNLLFSRVNIYDELELLLTNKRYYHFFYIINLIVKYSTLDNLFLSKYIKLFFDLFKKIKSNDFISEYEISVLYFNLFKNKILKLNGDYIFILLERLFLKGSISSFFHIIAYSENNKELYNEIFNVQLVKIYFSYKKDFIEKLKSQYYFIGLGDDEGNMKMTSDFIEALMKNNILRKDIYLNLFNQESAQQNKVNSFIRNSNSGSFLLSGYRGIGKTSLLKKSFFDFNKNNEEKIISIFVNIPEPDKKEGFSKRQLMNLIIRNLYKEIQKKEKYFPKDFINKLENQYIRTFEDVKNFRGSLIIRKKGVISFILNILKIGIPLFISIILFTFGNDFLPKEILNSFLNFDKYKLLISISVAIIGWKLSFIIFNINFNSQIAQELYDENISETKLVETLEAYELYKKTGFFKLGLKISKKSYHNLVELINNTFLGLILLYIFILLLLILILIIILIILFYLISLPYNIGVYIFYLFIFLLLLYIIAIFLKTILSKEKYKFVIVIDELDKLLDFDKNKDGIESSKVKMNEVFDILGKLKILFFDTTGLLFFVVTNKDAYDYHLMNKYQEDDLVSNIFNRILYLPMNEKEKFNLNFSVLGNKEAEDSKKKSSLSTERFNSLENTFSNKELSNFNKWLYFKSHGNWRKMRFILNEKLDNNGKDNILKINLDDIKFENKFYDFFEKLYYIFKIETLEKIEKGNPLYEFLIGKEGEGSKERLLIEFIKGPFYKKYLLNIGNIIENFSKRKKNNINILLLDLLNNIKDKEGEENHSSGKIFKNIGFFIASIEKISNEMAFRDYILNNLLNFYEALKFNKKIDIETLFRTIKITKDDLDYPAFEDFILYWVPFMLYYFGEKELINKDGLEKIFGKNNTKRNLSIKGFNSLSIYSKKEENILIDIFLKQSIDNLNKEGGFKLDFEKIRNDIEWREFIETKLRISFGMVKKKDINNEKNGISENVFKFWKNKVIGKILEDNKFSYLRKLSISKESFFESYVNLNEFYINNIKELNQKNNFFDNYILLKYGILYADYEDKILNKLVHDRNLIDKNLFFEYDFNKIVSSNRDKDSSEYIINIIKSKINSLDDIKVIKEEWFI